MPVHWPKKWHRSVLWQFCDIPRSSQDLCLTKIALDLFCGSLWKPHSISESFKQSERKNIRFVKNSDTQDLVQCPWPTLR